MDELAAAASTLAFAVDAFAEEEVENDEAGIESSSKELHSVAVETMAVDSDGQGPEAAHGEVGDGKSQVIKTLPRMLNTPFAQSLTPCDSRDGNGLRNPP